MKALDFARSYLTFVTKERSNWARIQLESRCEMRDSEGKSEEFFLFAACRAEDTYGQGALFRIPNYEFCGIFSRNDYLIIRTHARAEDNDPSMGAIKDFFEEVRIDVAPGAAEVLPTNETMVQATLANRPLVGQTEFSWPAGEGRVILEYPIKTMNVNPDRNCFQVDTGPLAFPVSPLTGASSLLEVFRLAHVVFSRLDKAEFILQVPTTLTSGVATATVNHYSEVREIAAQNRLLLSLA